MTEQIFHATIGNCTVEKLDPAALDFSAWILHDLVWLTQQGMVDEALSQIEWYAKLDQKEFIKACANGLTAVLDALRQTNHTTAKAKINKF